MTERNQDGYQALGWILNHAEQGFFLVVAEEELQKEILSVYREGPVAVYDYREHPGPYSFQGFSAWLAGQEDVQTVFLANLQLAVQTEEDVKRLNFSRDMLARLEKNLIFLTTPYGDDLLATGAYDFYSFLKLRILFSPQPLEDLVQKRLAPPCPTAPTEERWTPEETRRRLRDTDSLLEQAKKAVNQELEALLLQTLDLRERLLGPEHLNLSPIYQDLAQVYTRQARYQEAETLYKRALDIEKKVWGEDHPSTVNCYDNLADLYHKEGKYAQAEQWAKKAASIRARGQGRGNEA